MSLEQNLCNGCEITVFKWPATKQQTAEWTAYFVFTAAKTGSMYDNGHVTCILVQTNITSYTELKLIWTEIVLN